MLIVLYQIGASVINHVAVETKHEQLLHQYLNLEKRVLYCHKFVIHNHVHVQGMLVSIYVQGTDKKSGTTLKSQFFYNGDIEFSNDVGAKMWNKSDANSEYIVLSGYT